MKWNEMASADEVWQAYKKKAALTGKILVIDNKIRDVEIDVKEKHPRKPHERDRVTVELRAEKVKLEQELLLVEADIKFYEFQATIWRGIRFEDREYL